MLTTSNKKLGWLIYFFVVAIFLFVVHSLNTRWDRTRVEPISLVEKKRQDFEARVTQLEPGSGAKTFNSLMAGDQGIPGFTVDYPASWSARLVDQTNDSKVPLAVLFSPANLTKECIQVFQSRDDMPILEAKNYNPFMLEKPGVPYLTKFDAIGTDVETSLNGLDVVIGKLQLDSTKPGELVDNAVLVKDNTYTYILRGCLETDETIFLSVYKSFKLYSSTPGVVIP